MKAYLEILQNIVSNGVDKQPVRFDTEGNPIPVENGTIGTFCEVFRHNMSDGFPLLTTRRVPIKSLAVELEGFINGITSKKWYQDRKCKYWDHWANPQVVNAEFLNLYEEVPKKELQKRLDDLGPIYGYQWRNFDGEYKSNCFGDGTDQLKSIVDKLKENPYDRRMICSAWNPNQIHLMALPPCHILYNVVVYGNKLNLVWFQRSCDIPIGVPSNIASYALLLKLLAKEGGLEEGELVGILADAHIYSNQLDGVKDQLTREPSKLPTLTIPDENWNGIFEWTHEDMIVKDYKPQSKIDFGSITV